MGIICSCSGAYGAAFLPGQDAFVSWANTVNAGGGVDGRTVKVIEEDDGANPSQSATRFRSLVSQGAVAIVDLSLVDAAWTSQLATAKIAILAGPTASLNDMIFWAGQSSSGSSNGEATVAVAKAAGAKNIGEFYCVETPTCAAGVQTLAAAAKAGSLTIAYKAAITTAQPNFTAECVAARQAGVQSLSIGEQPTTIARAAADCAKQGYHPIYIGNLISWAPTFAQSPGLEDNTWLSSTNYPYFDSAQPEIKAMDASVDKYFPSVLGGAATPAELVVEQWANGLLLADAAKAAKAGSGSYTASEILSGLYALKGDTLDGLAAPLTFTPGTNHDNTCWFTAHFGAGKYSVGNGGKPTCASAS